MTFKEEIIGLSGKTLNEEKSYEQLKDELELEAFKRSNVEKKFSEFKNKLAGKLQHYYTQLEEAKKMKMTADVGEVILNNMDDIFFILKSMDIKFDD